MAQLKQSMIIANSGEQSYFTKIISDEDSCLFSINSQLMDLINQEQELDDSEFNSDSLEDVRDHQQALDLN